MASVEFNALEIRSSLCSITRGDSAFDAAEDASSRMVAEQNRSGRPGLLALIAKPLLWPLWTAFLVCIALAGCGGSIHPVVGTITFPNGNINSVAPGAAVAMTATTSGDVKGLGVDWSVTCTPPVGAIGAPANACGTFSPAHTASGAYTNFTAPNAIPADATVTITATSTMDPTRTSSLKLTIAGAALSVAITPPVANVEVDGQAQFTATVSNDPANVGVDWSLTCGQQSGLDCGQLLQLQSTSGSPVTYVAPAVIPSGLVTLTATSVTNPTITAQSILTIVPAITVNFFTAPPAILAPGSSTNLIAVVSNDFGSAGVTWSATAGSFSLAQTASGAATIYTAPAGVATGTPVTITATSVTDATKTASATVTIAFNISVGISTAVATMHAGSSAGFAATVTNDGANAGVRWTASAGTFSPTQTASGVSTTYTAPGAIPAGGAVTITATSITDPTKSATATVTITAPSIAIIIAPPTASVQAGGIAGFVAVVTNDSSNSGVTWSATAGTFSPAQTVSGAATIYTAPSSVPVGGSVTITATSVADPTKTATATVTVTPASLPISVSVSPATVSLQVGTTQMFTAMVSNDVSNGGVKWTATAGTLSVAQTASGAATVYTAPSTVPSGGIVTITATSVSNPAKTATAIVTVSTVVQPISVSVSPSTAALAQGATQSFTATVSNDAANGGVNWTATAGTFSVTQTASGTATVYTAPSSVPSGGTATITATSVTDPTKTATSIVTISASTPISVSVSPSTASLQTGATQSFTATIANDASNGGVNWTTTAGSVSSVQTASGTATIYTAPSTVPTGGTATITATSVIDPTKSATAVVTITAVSSSVTLNGQYAFSMTGQNITGGSLDFAYEAYLGSFTADGNGNITAGEVDFNSFDLPNFAVNVAGLTGTYSLDATGRGTIALANSAQAYTLNLSVTLANANHGLIMSTADDPNNGVLNGTLDLQTASSFSTPLSGSYAFTFSLPDTNGFEPDDLGGVLTVSNGTITNYFTDENNSGSVTTGSTSASDTFGPPDSNGRGTVTLSAFGAQSTLPFAYYVVDSTHFIFATTVGGAGMGTAYLQPATLPTSLAGSYAFTAAGFNAGGSISQYTDAGGVFTCDAGGSLTKGTLDVNSNGAFTTGAISGTCALDSPADGRGTVTVTSGGSGGVASFAVYPTANNGYLMLELDATAEGTGAEYPQAAGVSASTFTGNYAAGFFTQGIGEGGSTTLLGPVTASGTSALSGIVDINDSAEQAATAGATLTGTGSLTDTGSGRLTGEFTTSATTAGNSFVYDLKQVFYVVDANTVLSLESDTSPGTGILQLQNLTTP